MTLPIPETMTCIEITEPGEADVLRPAERPVPTPNAGEILIRVEAAGVNRPDVMQRQGLYPAPPGASDLPGLEVAGHVAGLGDGVIGWSMGEPICALTPGGGYAEFVTTPAAQCLPIPDGLSAVQAAALPETFFTVWSNVFQRGRLMPGESLLVHGGSSGIGTTAIQLASRLGSRVMVTAGSDEKCAACLELGAERAVNYHDADFVEAAREFSANEFGKGVDVILDMVGGDYIERNIKSLAPDGRLVQIAFQKSPKVEVNMMPVMLKRLTLTGSTLRPQPIEWKAKISQALIENVWPLLASGEVKPVIFATHPLADAADAHRLMESSQHIGKIVLTV